VVARQWFWRPKILNYPVQGLGADLVMLARISAFKRLNALGFDDNIKMCSSVHDSVVVDIDNSKDLCYTVGKVLKDSVEAVPSNFSKVFGVEFNLPLTAEIKCGNDLFNMEKIDAGNLK
jgi:DNA polymerase I-like protein with 3'-5' exonuclease and polymerase domains